MGEVEQEVLPGVRIDDGVGLWKIDGYVVAACCHVSCDTRAAELYVLDRYPKTTFGPWLQYENPTFELGLTHEPGVHGPVLVSLCNRYKPPSTR